MRASICSNVKKYFYSAKLDISGSNSLPDNGREQRSKFDSAVGKCRGFCRGISPFYIICLGNKNAEAVKFFQI